MTVPSDNHEHDLLSSHLKEVQGRVREGQFQEALESIQQARVTEPHNLYVIALQKQVERLRDLSHDKSLSESTRREIQRTLEAVASRAVSVHANDQPLEREIAEREEALENVRRSYLQRADEYLAEGDLQRALREVRRLHILHPHDPEAERYEKKINNILGLQNPVPDEATIESPMGLRAETESPFAPAPEKQASRMEPTIAMPAFQDEGFPEEGHPRAIRWSTILFISAILLIAIITLSIMLGGREEHEGQSPLSGNAPSSIGGVAMEGKRTDESGSGGAILENIEISPPKGNVPTNFTAGGDLKAQESIPRADQTSAGNEETNVTKIPPVLPQIRNTGADQLTPSYVENQELPQLKRFVMPQYPELALRTGAEGEVKVRVQVGPSGKPLQAKILESTNPVFNEAAISAMLSAEFEPGKMPSGPVTSWVTVPLTFRRPK